MRPSLGLKSSFMESWGSFQARSSLDFVPIACHHRVGYADLSELPMPFRIILSSPLCVLRFSSCYCSRKQALSTEGRSAEVAPAAEACGRRFFFRTTETCGRRFFFRTVEACGRRVFFRTAGGQEGRRTRGLQRGLDSKIVSKAEPFISWVASVLGTRNGRQQK